MARTRGLGRGLDALLRPQETEDELTFLSPKDLQAGKYQPRTQMDAEALENLAKSIESQGMMQPILVRPLKVAAFGKPRYEIIAGERRWRAALLIELEEIPVLIRNIEDEAALAMALIENIQRENLNPLEEALGLQRLTTEFQMTHEEIGRAIGRSRSNVGNLMRLLNLCDTVKEMLLNNELDMGHARALLTLDAASQIALAQKIVQKNLAVREVEREVANIQKAKQSHTKNKKNTRADSDLIRLEEELADHLNARVMIRASAKGNGRLTIHFANNEQLENLIDKLRE